MFQLGEIFTFFVNIGKNS